MPDHDSVIAAYRAAHPEDADALDAGQVPFLLNLQLALLTPKDHDSAGTIAQARQGTVALDDKLLLPDELWAPPDVIKERRAIRDELARFDAGRADQASAIVFPPEDTMEASGGA